MHLLIYMGFLSESIKLAISTLPEISLSMSKHNSPYKETEGDHTSIQALVDNGSRLFTKVVIDSEV